MFVHVPDAIAATIAPFVVADVRVRIHRPGLHGFDVLGLKSIPKLIYVVAAIAEQQLRFWQVVRQRCRTGTTAGLSSGHKKPLRGDPSHRRRRRTLLSCRF